MNVFFLIVVNVITPVFSLIGAGVLLHRIFKFDMNTLSKLTTYFLMPAVGFMNLYESKIAGGVLFEIAGFLLVQNLGLILIAALIAKSFRFEKSLASTFKNSMVLSNSGNFGLPVSQLVFQGNPLGQSIQVVVLIFQNLLTYTYGLMNAVSVHNKPSKSVLEFLKLPILYAMLAGLVLHALGVKIPYFIQNPIENVSNAFVAVALVTLGAQVAYLDIKKVSLPLLLSLVGRLVVSPLLALLVITVLGMEGTTAQALFIASSFPTSRNSSLFALEYNNHPEYAAQAVLLSTVLSTVTVTLVVYLSALMF